MKNCLHVGSERCWFSLTVILKPASDETSHLTEGTSVFTLGHDCLLRDEAKEETLQNLGPFALRRIRILCDTGLGYFLNGVVYLPSADKAVEVTP